MIYYNDDDLDNPSVAPFIESAIEDNPFYEEIHEKGYFKKLALPFKLYSMNKKLPKDEQIKGMISRYKKHSYPAYTKYVSTCDDPEILDYLMQDVNAFLYTLRVQRKRLEKVKKLGECEETKSYYKFYKKFIDAGITPHDIDLNIKDVENTKKLIAQRKRKLKKVQKESQFFYDEYEDGDSFYDGIHEGKSFKKFTLAGEIRRINDKMPADQKIVNFPIDIYKKHGYPAYSKYITMCDDMEILNYLRRDLNTSAYTYQKQKERLMKVKKLGDCKETRAYYDYFSKLIDEGITPRDIDLCIKNNERNKELIAKRKRELRKIQKESQFFYDENGYDEWLEENLDNDGEDNVASESPVSFVSQKSKPVKNQKAHLRYIKKKAHDNPTNNATGQKEMPSANSFNI